jgi:hypothetical protein
MCRPAESFCDCLHHHGRPEWGRRKSESVELDASVVDGVSSWRSELDVVHQRSLHHVGPSSPDPDNWQADRRDDFPRWLRVAADPAGWTETHHRQHRHPDDARQRPLRPPLAPIRMRTVSQMQNAANATTIPSRIAKNARSLMPNYFFAGVTTRFCLTGSAESTLYRMAPRSAPPFRTKVSCDR